jgi:hypothetical protein
MQLPLKGLVPCLSEVLRHDFLNEYCVVVDSERISTRGPGYDPVAVVSFHVFQQLEELHGERYSIRHGQGARPSRQEGFIEEGLSHVSSIMVVAHGLNQQGRHV